MTTKLQEYPHTENGVTAYLNKKTAPKRGRVCGYIHPCVPVFAEAQRVFGLTEETISANKLFLLMARKCGMTIKAEDLDRYAQLTTVLPQAVVPQPIMATADTTQVVVPPKPESKLNQGLLDWIATQKAAKISDKNIRQMLKEAGNSEAVIEAHFPTIG